MALPDLLQWLAGAGKTGSLCLANEHFKKEILFRDGVIVASSSDDPREFLGQFLLAHRKITEEQLRKAMESQRSTGVMLGKILVMVGAVDGAEISEMLTMKAEESLFNLFLWKRGSFTFEDGNIETEIEFPLTLRVEDVLMEGLRRYDELQVILKAFAPGESVLERTDAPLPRKLAESSEVRRLLEVVDGKRTLTDLCLELHAPEFRVSRIAYELFRLNCLRLVKPPDHGGDNDQHGLSADELVARATRLLDRQKFEKALQLLANAVQLRPSDLAMRQALDDAEQRFVERAHQHYLPPDKVPRLERSLEQMTNENLTPQEVFLATRINGTWTVKDIITISPMREVETLLVLKHLRERGLISLGET